MKGVFQRVARRRTFTAPSKNNHRKAANLPRFCMAVPGARRETVSSQCQELPNCSASFLFSNQIASKKLEEGATRASYTRLTPNPVAKTVTDTCLPQRSSTRAPMMMLASGCTCFWMMLAAAFT